MTDWAGRYMSEAEIINDIMSKWSDEAYRDFRAIRKEDLIMLHHGFGMWIRNHYGLWHEQNPYVKVNAAPNAQGVIDDELFPDAVSQRIIETMWDKVRREEILID